MSTRADSGPQTRQLMEAGVSTSKGTVELRTVKAGETSSSEPNQTNNFKPVNNGPSTWNNQNDDKLNTKPDNSDGENSQEHPKKTSLVKTRSSGASTCQLRQPRCTKISSNHAPNSIGQNRSVDGGDNSSEDEELPRNTGRFSLPSLLTSLEDEIPGKCKTASKANQKSSRNLAHSKSRDNKSVSSSVEKPKPEAKDPLENKELMAEREKLCLRWMQSLADYKKELNMESEQQLSDDEVPEFCSNKTCPISELKIVKTAKVLKQAKKVELRKAIFDTDDERWYCLKCLKSHDDCLFCFYCGQIYFTDETDMEDDGKCWICCDTCDRWVSILNLPFFTSFPLP